MVAINNEAKKKAAEIARQSYVYISQLYALKETVERRGGRIGAREQLVSSYNMILRKLKKVFSTDPNFSSLIEHIEEDSGRGLSGIQIVHRVLLSIGQLIATIESIVRLYLPPEEKKKIGF